MAGDQPDRRLFSVRMLLFALVVLAILGYRTVDFALKRHAIRKVESLGGVVYFDDKPLHLAAAPRTFKDELKQLAGLSRPGMVYLSGKSVTDATVDDYLRALGSLDTVWLENVAVSDQALLRLASLRSLEHITCTRHPRNAAVFDELADPAKIDFTLTPLNDGLAYLDDYHGIRFVADKTALAAVGVHDSLPITYRTRHQIALGTALDEMLAPHKLAWIVRDGAVVVTTSATAQKSKRTADQLRRELPNLKEVRIDAN